MTSMVGTALRSTMDIDTTIRSQTLTVDTAQRLIDEIKDIDPGDGVVFEIKDVMSIMDEMEYPGIRVNMNTKMGGMVTPVKIDISTGDTITPHAIEYQYRLLLEDRSIRLWSYNLETILAEKLQTVLARGVLNTRMRDFYDIRTLLTVYEHDIDEDILSRAFDATCINRGTGNLKTESVKIIMAIETDWQLSRLWESYRKKYPYASEISYEDVILSIKNLVDKIQHQ